MVTRYDIKAADLIDTAAEQLKKNEAVQPPEWAGFVKLGAHRERPPARKDWWYVRSAAVLRKVDRYGPVGVTKLKKKFGGRKNRGVRPDKTVDGSGHVIRTIFQQLEKAQLIQKGEVGRHKGRVITPKGISFLDNSAMKFAKDNNIDVNAPVVTPPPKPAVAPKKAPKPEAKSETKQEAKAEEKKAPAPKKEEAKDAAPAKPAKTEAKPKAEEKSEEKK